MRKATPTSAGPRSRIRIAGFTLMELMVTITIAGILAGVAIPNMRDFIRNNRLTSVANDLLRSMQLARTEAIKRQQTVGICTSTDVSTCSNGVFSGWIVFQDTNANGTRDVASEPLIETHARDTNVTVKNDGTAISYAHTGFANPGGVRNVVACDSRGNATVGSNSAARAVLIDATGRTRVTKLAGEVTTAIAATGACP